MMQNERTLDVAFHAGLDILADACMGLGCDEQLEPQMDTSPFKPLEPLGELPDLALAPSENATLAHLSGQLPGASALAYPSAALAQRILGERSEAPALSDLPAQVRICPPTLCACTMSFSTSTRALCGGCESFMTSLLGSFFLKPAEGLS